MRKLLLTCMLLFSAHAEEGVNWHSDLALGAAEAHEKNKPLLLLYLPILQLCSKKKNWKQPKT